jgi:hypothetical protein
MYGKIFVYRTGYIEKIGVVDEQGTALSLTEVGNQSDIGWHTWELGEVYRLRVISIKLKDITRMHTRYSKNSRIILVVVTTTEEWEILHYAQ